METTKLLNIPTVQTSTSTTTNGSESTGAETSLFAANETSGDSFTPTAENKEFDPDKAENMDDFEFIDDYDERNLNTPTYNFHYQQYKEMQKIYGKDMNFKSYLELINVNYNYVLQRMENYMETGNENFGNGVDQDKLNADRCYKNPDNKNQEIYWNEDKTKYYMIDWDKGIYKSVDPNELPFYPEPPEDKDYSSGEAPVPDMPGKDPVITDDELERLRELDPIGYKDKNGNSFDFVIDRNNDGIFNGPSEFLGALNNWSEMEKLDKDGNGIVEGSELAGLMLLKTGTDGVQAFISAIASNLKIYLDSYFKADKDEKDENDQTLLGNYTVSADGETTRGYNTLDSMDYLNEKYGNMFNKKLA